MNEPKPDPALQMSEKMREGLRRLLARVRATPLRLYDPDGDANATQPHPQPKSLNTDEQEGE